MNSWIGTSGFQYPEWKGKFYPADLSLARMLSWYAGRIASTEINYSFRHIPSAKTIARWSKETPAGFRFSLKAPQKITHFAKLRGCRKTLAVFHRAVSPLAEKLGPTLFQLPPTFKKDVDGLKKFLAVIPSGMHAAFEFRHESWFDAGIFSLLGEANAALCIAENEERLTPAVATADFGYLRLRREDYKPRDLKRWSAMVQKHESVWQDVFIYFKHEERAVGPKFAIQMSKALGLGGRM